MSDDRVKLLKIMGSLEDDYKSGKISADKYSYFRSKYEDKLNTIDAQAATRRIRSMQGKSSDSNSSNNKKRRRSKKPARSKKKEEQDLVQKYIINPKKGDAKYNKTKKSSMDSGTFKLLLLLVLVIGFTAGVAYGIFSFDFNAISSSDSVAIVQDTAFPEFKEVKVINTTTTSHHTSNSIETTTDDSSSTPVTPDSGGDSGGGDSGGGDSGGGSDPTPTPTPSPNP